jgi:4-amino-4-deoxy-L-arabinose transferase-like glycosyltransferase
MRESGPRGVSVAAFPFVVALVAFVANLMLARAYPLIDPDEGRNAEVAREMAAGSNLVIPHLAGMPYLDKPPGLFWIGALAIRAFGTEPWTARLPAAVAGAVTLGLLALAARRHRGMRFALTAVVLLASAPLFLVLSAYVIFDLLLGLCVTLVWLGLAGELEHGASRWRRVMMFAAVTAGVLVKGPVMLAWVLGGSLGAALLVRARTPLRWLAWIPGWLIVFGIAGGWFWLASQQHPEYPRYAFLEESFERLTTKSFQRDQPAWFVPAVLAAGALPWSLATPWALPAGIVSRVGVGFVLFAAVFFTASHSKLVTYLVPCLPPLAWLAAEAWCDPARARRGAWAAAAVLALLAIGIAIVAPRAGVATASLGMPVPPAALKLALGLGLAAVVAGIGAVRQRPVWAIAALVAFMPLVFASVGPMLVRYAATQSGGPLARAIVAAAPGARVRYEHCYSAGTDYRLGQTSDLVSATGEETTSIYQARYRATLQRRGRWSAWPDSSVAPVAQVIVRRAHNPSPPPAGSVEFFRDRRFVAFRRTSETGTR